MKDEQEMTQYGSWRIGERRWEISLGNWNEIIDYVRRVAVEGLYRVFLKVHTEKNLVMENVRRK